MKEKVKKFVERFKSELSLFVFAFTVTLLTAAACSLCGTSDLGQVTVAASVGLISVMGMEYMEELAGMKLGDSKRPAYIGIIVGVLIALF